MPREISKVVDVRTSPIPQRIAAINDFVAAGYEVHLNFVYAPAPRQSCLFYTSDAADDNEG